MRGTPEAYPSGLLALRILPSRNHILPINSIYVLSGTVNTPLKCVTVLIAGFSDPLGEGPYTTGYRARQTPTLLPPSGPLFSGARAVREYAVRCGVRLYGKRGTRDPSLGRQSFARDRDRRPGVCTLSLPAMRAGFRTRTWPVGVESRARRCPQGPLPSRFLEPRVDFRALP
jgi:hypothetical protein